MKQKITLAIIILVLLVSLALIITSSRRSQDTRGKATSATGTVRYTLVAPSAMPPGSVIEIPVSMTSTSVGLVDGFQMAVTATGTVPRDLSFVPVVMDGLTAVDTHARKIAQLTSDPRQPYALMANRPLALATVRFTVPATGTLTLSFDPQLSKVMQHTTGKDILAPAQPLTLQFDTHTPSSPSPTIPPVITGSTKSFFFKTKVNGITNISQPFKARVSIQNLGELNPKTHELILDYTGGGIFTGIYTPSSQEPALKDGFRMALKGEKHVQRVFTNLHLTPAGQYMDLTNKPLQPGDLPSQDGVVDAQDIAKIIAILGKPTQDSNDLQIGDLNYDGVVNAADLSLLFATLSQKQDEGI